MKRENLKDSIHYWLGRSRDFNINDEYEVKLLFIDIKNYSAKIQITNLKTKETETVEVSNA